MIGEKKTAGKGQKRVILRSPGESSRRLKSIVLALVLFAGIFTAPELLYLNSSESSLPAHGTGFVSETEVQTAQVSQVGKNGNQTTAQIAESAIKGKDAAANETALPIASPAKKTASYGEATHKVLIILGVPFDLWSDEANGPDPEQVSNWYSSNGVEWYRNTLAEEITSYYNRITYGRYVLSINVTDWYRLPFPRYIEGQKSYAEDRWLEVKHAVQAAEENYTVDNYDFVVVIDPTSPYSYEFKDDWTQDAGGNSSKATVWGWFKPNVYHSKGAVFTGTFYSGNGYFSEPLPVMTKIIAHEISHAIDYSKDGKYQLLDNQGDEYSLMGKAYGGEPPLAPYDEETLLGTDSRGLSSANASVLLEPRENGPGQAVKFYSGGKEYFVEYRLVEAPGFKQEEKPAVLVWSLSGVGVHNSATLENSFHAPGEFENSGVSIMVHDIGSATANVTIRYS